MVLAALVVAPAAAQKAPARSAEEQQASSEAARLAVEDALAEMATEERAARDLATVNVWNAQAYYNKYRRSGPERWLELFTAANGPWMVDLRTVDASTGIRTVWVETGDTNGKYRQHMHIDCKAGVQTFRTYVSYRSDGTTKVTGENTAPMAPIVPDTPVEFIQDWLCADAP